MKKTFLTLFTIGFLATAPAFAQTMMGGNEMGPGMMTENQQQNSNVPNDEYVRHMQERMMKNNYSMMGGGYNMMGSYGMIPMIGKGYGTPPCTTGGGYNMMNRSDMMPMMMGGYGMMPMMGGFGMMQNLGYDNYKKYEAFAKETKDLRKKLHDLMFEYGEARWNPDTKIGDLNKMAEEINKLREDIHKRMPQ